MTTFPRTFTIHIEGCKDLLNRDGLGRGLSDPYVLVTHNKQQKHKTTTVDNALDPKWTEKMGPSWWRWTIRTALSWRLWFGMRTRSLTISWGKRSLTWEARSMRGGRYWLWSSGSLSLTLKSRRLKASWGRSAWSGRAWPRRRQFNGSSLFFNGSSLFSSSLFLMAV